VRFSWSDLGALPEFAITYGRYVPLARSTLVCAAPAAADPEPPAAEDSSSETSTPPSLHGLALDRARQASAGAEPLWPSPERILPRARGFSAMIRGLRFQSIERRILTLSNGRATLREIAARAGLREEDVRRAAYALMEAGLLSSEEVSRPVLILEPDEAGFRDPLASLLSQRANPVPLRAVAEGEDVVAAALREAPSVVILNAKATPDPHGVAQALRQKEELAGVPLVAVLDLDAAERGPELRAAGFDAVLVKPVPYAELERLVGS
jgi:CheY-like chemotaxis protein